MIRRLKDPYIREKAIQEMQKDDMDYSKIIISISPLNKTLTRKKIIDISRSQGKSVEETIIDILIAGEGRVITMMDILSEKNVAKAIRNPFSIIASNGAGYDFDYIHSGDLVHPRNFGAFPRALARYVRDKRILSWEEAIRKISGRPAEKFGIPERGLIRENYFADVVALDPNKIQDLATPENPYQYSMGINEVIVNGEAVLENGKYNGKRNGQVIRKENRGWF